MKIDKNKLVGCPALPALVMCFIFFFINIYFTNGFLQPHIILSFLSSNIPLICVSMGCACVIISGGMDISLGAIVSLTNVIFIKLNAAGLPLSAQIAMCLIAAILMGLINGVIIGVLRVTPLLATYATSTAYAGIALWILPTPAGTVNRDYCSWYNSWLWDVIPVPVLFVLLIFVLWFLTMRTPMYYWVYSTGCHAARAYVSAVPVGKTQVFTYIFAGFAAGVASLAISGSTQGGDASVGISLSMNAIAACVIGGIGLAGGIGSLIGSVFGSVFLSLVMFVVSSAHITSIYQSLVKGVILLVGVLFSILIENRLQREGLCDTKLPAFVSKIGGSADA